MVLDATIVSLSIDLITCEQIESMSTRNSGPQSLI